MFRVCLGSATIYLNFIEIGGNESFLGLGLGLGLGSNDYKTLFLACKCSDSREIL